MAARVQSASAGDPRGVASIPGVGIRESLPLADSNPVYQALTNRFAECKRSIAGYVCECAPARGQFVCALFNDDGFLVFDWEETHEPT
jgi:hypothetical protein